jgi:hypothetical protein
MLESMINLGIEKVVGVVFMLGAAIAFAICILIFIIYKGRKSND